MVERHVAKVRAREARVGEVRPGEVRTAEGRIAEVRAPKVCADEDRAIEVNPLGIALYIPASDHADSSLNVGPCPSFAFPAVLWWPLLA